jgi:hypothetical protein
MWATILGILKSLFDAVPILAKYFPPKTPQDRSEETEAEVHSRVEKEKQTGRPT